METIITILTVVLVAMLVAATLTFGFALLIWFVLFAAIVTFFVMVRQLWYRWRFLHTSGHDPEPEIKIIEVEYEDLSKKD